jgi:hypothetical protein
MSIYSGLINIPQVRRTVLKRLSKAVMHYITKVLTAFLFREGVPKHNHWVTTALFVSNTLEALDHSFDGVSVRAVPEPMS